MNLQEAQKVALEFIDQISPYCKRVEVAGSVRRLKPEPHDIEIVASPLFEQRPRVGVLVEEMENVNMLHLRMEFLLKLGIVNQNRPSKNGAQSPFGPKYYRVMYSVFGVLYPIDLFVVTPPADFGVIFTIRTGSADYSHMLVTRALQLGKKVKDGRLYATHFRDKEEEWEYIPCPEEENFFAALDLDMPLPEERV